MQLLLFSPPPRSHQSPLRSSGMIFKCWQRWEAAGRLLTLLLCFFCSKFCILHSWPRETPSPPPHQVAPVQGWSEKMSASGGGCEWSRVLVELPSHPPSTYTASAKTIPYLAEGSVCPGIGPCGPLPGPVYSGTDHSDVRALQVC